MSDASAEDVWRPVTRVRAYQHVVDQVEEQILAGTLKVGDRLPGERDLATRMQVSRAAVREAMRTLEAHGVVRPAVGSGADAGTVVSAMPSEALTRLLRVHVALANFPVADVVDARCMLERSSATLAAGRATPAALSAVAAPLAAMEATEALDRSRAGDGHPDGRQAYNDLDTAFHIAIAEAGGNRLVADITIAIREAMRRPILEGLERLGEEWPAVRRRLSQEHRGVFEAIAVGDGVRAADLVEAHIRSAHARLS
ncbi:GntR family transcriptional regulator, transcriptional repressor for pyruvate dehydrogenase complex [Nocardioides terrae]|uniref:GntR family transcriptional regulator, transcriptional repressor for pyruvate dehydrogenase complex n=1 Tax=Nocardioides terrae TaxID=574651 RepID=A0A1I1N387_9ACTN|nr:FCD domain-containing protein [Nocardioides terrae]SFC92087.1 GntR family transcriptional regulator, transcriptional repressor for pyruvate dehydrogenase complex [Nocardioides terrae]